MDKKVKLRELELFVRKASQFKNVTTNGEWVNFSCLLAQHSQEHRFTDDKSPSAGITIGQDGKVYYKCFTCKHQGPFEKTIERYETKAKVSLSALRQLVQESEELPDYEYLHTYAGERVKSEPLPFTNIFEPIINFPDARKYLADRNISETTATRIGLEYDPDARRIVFPVRDRKGLTYGYTGRSIDKDNKVKIKDYHFKKSEHLLGIELWNKEQPTILVEGLFAYAHLHEISKGKYFPYNIGAIMGSQISQEQADLLIEFGNPIYVLLDGDKAGQTGVKGKKGLIFFTKDNIPTFTMTYPKYELEVYGIKIPVQKFDPDSLTLEELFAMISKPRLVL